MGGSYINKYIYEKKRTHNHKPIALSKFLVWMGKRIENDLKAKLFSIIRYNYGNWIWKAESKCDNYFSFTWIYPDGALKENCVKRETFNFCN